jgi:negative regulator of sigma-B (phosphoserine phosphatase)
MLDTLSDRNKSLVQLGVWSMSAPDQAESGDRHLIKILPNGVLVGVVDGLGHGAEAAVAAKMAVHYLGWYARDTLIAAFQRCHLQLKNTRGVVMSLAFFDADQNTMTWLGVGNVEGLLVRADASMHPARESILLRGGVVGLKLPQLSASVLPVFPGDTLIFASDGIATTFGDSVTVKDSPQNIANRIGGQFNKGTDDALVLVARYSGTTNANRLARA